MNQKSYDETLGKIKTVFVQQRALDYCLEHLRQNENFGERSQAT